MTVVIGNASIVDTVLRPSVRIFGAAFDDTNYERWKISDGTVPNLVFEKGGTGVARVVKIGNTSGGATVFAGSPYNFNNADNSVNWWNLGAPGFYPGTDNTYDIGTTAYNVRTMYCRNVVARPSASITPANNGELVIEATNNTTLTFKLKGSDGVVRTGTLTLA